MNNYDPSAYGDRIAAVYDELFPEYDEACIDTLAELAQGGPALELGIGTGRVALPLHRRGVEVHGIDGSSAMVEKLRDKPGGEDIPVLLGNFMEVGVSGQFPLIYIVVNTFYGLLTQEDQIRCFRNVAEHLTEGGVFLIEAFVPDLKRFTDGQSFRVTSLDEDQVRLDAVQIDPVHQQLNTQHIILGEEGTKLYPVKIRYVWPSEFDLMARLTGLELRHRWGNWKQEAFTADSGRHISVYARGG